MFSFHLYGGFNFFIEQLGNLKLSAGLSILCSVVAIGD